MPWRAFAKNLLRVVTRPGAAYAVDVVRPPEAMAVTATYGLVVLRPTEEADCFVDGLSGPRGREMLAPHGFDPP